MYHYDLSTRRGETFHEEVIIKSGNEPLDLTGATAKSQIRPKAGSETLTQEIACSVDGSAGKVTMELTAEETMSIPAGKYQYDLLIQRGTEIRYYIGGSFTVEASVTVMEDEGGENA